MKLRVIKNNTKTFESKLKEKGYIDLAKCFDCHFYGDDNRAIEVNLKCKINIEEMKYLITIAKELNDIHAQNDAFLIIQMLNDTDGTLIKSLNGFMKAFETYIKKDLIDGWLYALDITGNYMPKLVDSIQHIPNNPETGQKAYVLIFFEFSSPRKEQMNHRGKKDNLTFELKEVYNKTIIQILGEKMLFKETEDLKLKYTKHLDAYNIYHSKIGMQFIATSNALSRNENYSEKSSIKGHKLVNDQFETDDMPSIAQETNASFFNESALTNNIFDEDIELKLLDNQKNVLMKLPFHPYIKMFDLESHKELWILPGNIKPYEYDKDVATKLVLQEDHRDLIDVLVNDADVVLEDIVSNKSGGTTILCKGEAGLGKTLTAEVYSETVSKPLYLVHSGQLGTNPDNIDKRLNEILKRTERWGAILLLDEADVYIRKRDNSMEHNAIVAAFLRKLERFSGIVFMTTNRSDDVDDAIASRCIAVITYTHPVGKDLYKLWKILSKQYKIELSNELTNQLCDLFEKTSGRDIKELLKLASKFKSQKQSVIDINMFKKCAMFRGLKLKKP